MAKFGQFKFSQAKFGTTGPTGGTGATGASGASGATGTPGGGWVDPREPRVPWLFQDVTAGTSYLLPINPLTHDIPAKAKRVTNQPTAAGMQVVYAGRPEVQSMTFSGTILEEAHFRALETWAKVNRQIKITDDLGREYWVYITAFEPTRQRNVPYPWRMEYSARATILDWGST